MIHQSEAPRARKVICQRSLHCLHDIGIRQYSYRNIVKFPYQYITTNVLDLSLSNAWKLPNQSYQSPMKRIWEHVIYILYVFCVT
jgi:hypothetical protein